MIDTLLQRIAAGEGLDGMEASVQVLAGDAAQRRAFAERAIEVFELAERIDPAMDVLGMATSSADGFREFLQGLQFFAAMKESFEQGLQPSDGPVASEADARPVPGDVDADAVEAAVATLRSAFFLGHRWDLEQTIEGDLFVLPGLELSSVQVRWTAGATADGPVEVAPPDEERAGFGAMVGSDGRQNSELKLVEDPGQDLVAASGACVLETPSRVARASFAAADVGQERADGDVTIRLDSVANDCVRVTVIGAPGETPRIIAGRDATGTRLRSRESQSQRTRGSWTTDVRFTGVVAAVEVLVVLEVARREFEVSASAPPQQDADGNWPVAVAPRYLPPRAVPQFVELSPADVEQFSVVAGRMTSMFEFNQSDLHVHLPLGANSAFAEIRWLDAEAEGPDGEVVSEQINERGATPALACQRYSFDGAEDPDAIARMRGTVEVRVPTVVREVLLTADEPAQPGLEASFEGATVTLRLTQPIGDEDGDAFGLSWLLRESDERPPTLQILDETGRPLRRMPYQSWCDDTATLVVHGRPVAVRAWLVEASATAQLAVDVDAAPKLDDVLRDSCEAPPSCR
ncbi:MAG: hypothetical protein H6835_17090 [Planctomycetes bacterium]|nr:hypothetical protein [Planctomycetota bacterium]